MVSSNRYAVLITVTLYCLLITGPNYRLTTTDYHIPLFRFGQKTVFN